MGYDWSGLLEKAKKVEVRFARDCDEFIREAKRNEDIYQHWDVKVKIKEEIMNVDVKGLKRLKRNEPLDESIQWIEIKRGKTLEKKHLGWLYGDADYFSFEMDEKWVVVDRKSLQDFVAKNTIKEYKNVPTLYHLYKRPNKYTNMDDVLTLVETEKLIEIAKYIVDKKHIVEHLKMELDQATKNENYELASQIKKEIDKYPNI
jgi:hypothetical protein